jgi:hypothetical protein
LENGKLTYADLPDVYKQLSADLPIEGAEKASKTMTRKGYDTTGYGYQYHVNRMNEVLFGHWRAIHQVTKETESLTSTKKTMYHLVSHMVIQIGNWVSVNGENHFEVLMEVDGYGGHSSLELDSAHKGTYTNAFKKVSAMFGVGRKAFEGTLDDDLLGAEQTEKSGKTTTTTVTTGNNQQQQTTQQPTKPVTQQTTENKQPPGEQGPQKLLSKAQRGKLIAEGKKRGITDEWQKAWCIKFYNKDSRNKLTSKEAAKVIDSFIKLTDDELLLKINEVKLHFQQLKGGVA